MKRILLFSLFIIASVLSIEAAPRLTVISVSGRPQVVNGKERTPIKAWDVLTPEVVINIPYDASIDIVDKEAGQQYHIKTPGRDRLQVFIANQKNGVMKCTQRYLQYISDQMKGGAKRAARGHSDAATVTREVKVYKGEATEEAEEGEEDWEAELRKFTEEAKAEQDAFTKDAVGEHEKFTQEVIDEYEAFRAEVNQQYAEFLEEAWQMFRSKEPIKKPENKEVKPMVIPDYKRIPTIKSRPIKIQGVVAPIEISPQPLPIEPIVQDKVVVVVEPTVVPIKVVDQTVPQLTMTDPTTPAPDISLPTVKIEPVPVPDPTPVGREVTFFGTKVYVRQAPEATFRLASLTEHDIAEAWKTLSQGQFNNTVADCLTIREQLRLSDWAYLNLLKNVGDALMGENTNEATMLAAYIFCQSGYKMRLGKSASRLALLFASRHMIYERAYFFVNGEDFYPFCGSDEADLAICTLPYPEEQSLSLLVTDEPRLADNESPQRLLEAKEGPKMKANVSVNRNLMDFYETYPSSEIGGNLMTRWAMYANTPLASNVRESLYPELKAQMEGLSQRDAVNKLLNFVQRSLTYEYDEVVWGADRPFFAEESLFYPYADCEDRSILFSRLVRDLVGLKVVLVYYPGHLATAVAFTDKVAGDYITLEGENFTVCDPTYIGAPVGMTMDSMDNAQAQVILLSNN